MKIENSYNSIKSQFLASPANRVLINIGRTNLKSENVECLKKLARFELDWENLLWK